MNPKRLFVGNLTYSVNEKELWGLFSRYGEVVGVRVLEGRGYGFVEMESYEDAQAAKNALNETEFKGRNLLIDSVRPHKLKPGFQKGSAGKQFQGRGGHGSGYERRKSHDSDHGSPNRSQKKKHGGSLEEVRGQERVFKSAPRPPGRKGNSAERGKPKDTHEKPVSSSHPVKPKTRFWPGGK